MAGTQQDLVLLLKLRDQFTTTLKPLNNVVQQATKSFQGLDNMLLKVGIGSIGLGFGLRFITNTAETMRKAATSAEIAVLQMGPAAVDAYNKMLPSFDAIAASTDTTKSAIQSAYGIIVSESRQPIISVQDLEHAVKLAAVAHISLSDAAKIVGQSLLGNVQPLADLLDPSGGFPGLEQTWKNVDKAFSDNRSGLVELQGTLGRMAEDIARALNPALSTVLDWINRMPGPVKTFAEAFIALTVAVAAAATAFAVLDILSLLNPIGLIVVAIVALIAAIITVAVYWRQIWSWIEDHGPLVALAVAGLLGPLGLVLDLIVFLAVHWKDVWDRIKAITSNVVDWLGNVWSGIQDVWNSAVGQLFRPVLGLFDTLGSTASGVIDFLKGFWRAVQGGWGDVASFVFGPIISLLGSIWSIAIGLCDFLKGFWTAVQGGWGDVASWLFGPIIGAAQRLKDLWDWLMSHNPFGGGGQAGAERLTSFTSTSPTSTAYRPSAASIAYSRTPAYTQAYAESLIPVFGAGGIARRPTLAMIGESGPEAIVPLRGGGGGYGGGNVTINLYGNVDSEIRLREMAREVKRVLQEDSRRGIPPY